MELGTLFAEILGVLPERRMWCVNACWIGYSRTLWTINFIFILKVSLQEEVCIKDLKVEMEWNEMDLVAIDFAMGLKFYTHCTFQQFSIEWVLVEEKVLSTTIAWSPKQKVS